MIRKILAVLTALTLVSSIIICPAYSADADNQQDYSGHCLGLMAALDMDVRIADPSSVTRGEFLYLLMQCINYVGSDSTGLPFTDVTPDSFYASAVKYALDAKIISASERFNPGVAIRYAEACKMTISALGMDYYAVYRGGWPTGYIAAASEAEITSGVSGDEFLTGDEALTVIWNFLHANVMEPDGIFVDGENVVKYTEGESVLGYYHDVYTADGIITANIYTGLYEANGKCEENEIEIDDITYKSSADLADMIGKNAVAYAVVDGNRAEVIFAYPYENNILSINAEDIDSVSGNALNYFAGDFEKKVKLAASPAFIYNLCADRDYKIENLKDADGEIVFVDNNGDKVYDVVHISQCETIVARSVNIYDGIISGEQNELIRMDDDETKVMLYFNDAPCAIGDIEAGALLEVYRSHGNEVVVIKAYSADTVSGIMTGLNAENRRIYIDDVEYKYNKYFEDYALSQCKMGKNITVILNSQKVVSALTERESDARYGYIIATKTPQSGLDTEVQIKMLTQDGKIEIFTLADKVIIDGTVCKKDEIDMSLLIFDSNSSNATQATAADWAKNTVRYRADAQKRIVMLDIAGPGDVGVLDKQKAEENNLTLFEYPGNVYSTIWFIQGTSMFHPYFRVGSSTAVFIVVPDSSIDDEKRFTVKTSAYFNSSKWAYAKKLFAFNVSETGNAGAVVLVEDSLGSDINEYSPSGVVYSANQAINSEGDSGISLVIFRNKAFEKYFILDPDVLKAKDAQGKEYTMTLVPGDYVSVNANSEGTVTGISRIYSAESGQISVTFGNHLDDNAYYYGMVYDKDSSGISIIPENIPGLTDGISNGSGRYRFAVPGQITVFDSESGAVFAGSPVEIVTYLQSETDCSKMIIKTDDGVVIDAVVFK